MAIVSRQDFADMCGVGANYINTYVGRGQVISLPDKRIDTENPINLLFKKKMIANRNKPIREKRIIEKKKESIKEEIQKELEKQTEQLYKNVVEPVLEVTKKESKQSKKERDEINAKSAEIVDWDLRKKKADALKAEQQAEKERLNVEKLMGSLMPVDLVEQIIRVNVQDIFKTFEGELVNLASIYCDILAGGDREKLAEVIKEMREKLTFIIEKTSATALSEVENAVEEYAEVRSRGERK
jgi:hypothetical protein